MAVAAGGRIFCKVLGENILPFGGACGRHPIRYVTFGILFCQVLNSTQDYIKICTNSHQLDIQLDIFSQRQNIVKNVSLHAGLQLIYGLSPRFCQSVLNGLYGNGMTGVTKNLPAQTSQ